MSTQRLLFRKTKLLFRATPISASIPVLEQVHCSNESPITIASSADAFLVEKIMWTLKQGTHSRTSLFLRLNASVYLQVVTKCRDDLRSASKFIDFVALNHPNFKHSSTSLSAAIHILVRCKRVSEAQALILRMVRKSGVSRAEIVEAMVYTYNICGSNLYAFDLLVRTYVQARKLREAVEAFRLLLSRRFCVTINACNSLLGGLVRIEWVDLAWEVYREVIRSGVPVNVYTLNIMVNAFCKVGKIEDAKLFIDEREEKGIFGDVVTYNTLISAYCREGHLEEVFELMNVMSLKGLKPCLLTYNSIVNGLCKNRQYQKARDVLNEMVHSGFVPDTTSYNTLLAECCRKDNASEAESIFEEMARLGALPDLKSFCIRSYEDA
nr:pentatricopeptide repeat-containing protein At5g01110 [Ipomoea trifida]